MLGLHFGYMETLYRGLTDGFDMSLMSVNVVPKQFHVSIVRTTTSNAEHATVQSTIMTSSSDVTRSEGQGSNDSKNPDETVESFSRMLKVKNQINDKLGQLAQKLFWRGSTGVWSTIFFTTPPVATVKWSLIRLRLFIGRLCSANIITNE